MGCQSSGRIGLAFLLKSDANSEPTEQCIADSKNLSCARLTSLINELSIKVRSQRPFHQHPVNCEPGWGNGECRHCKGKGKKYVAPLLSSATYTCPYCNGSKACGVCKGTGKV